MTAPSMATVDRHLAVVYTAEGINIWWGARNRALGGRSPLYLWNNGEEARARVAAEAERLAGGAW